MQATFPSQFLSWMRSMLNMEENPRRQPFFPLADDLIDEEFYDEQLPEKETTAHSKAGEAMRATIKYFQVEP
uniref:Uncharacterized protein n=1 Tax=Nelumbo nucifera TaxID=4432 RepID=A0A822XNH4_NELNU|nr:TPA_asm: hypothetical protein HUJ06_022716 [Nelumbo nucifera]